MDWSEPVYVTVRAKTCSPPDPYIAFPVFSLSKFIFYLKSLLSLSYLPALLSPELLEEQGAADPVLEGVTFHVK